MIGRRLTHKNNYQVLVMNPFNLIAFAFALPKPTTVLHAPAPG